MLSVLREACENKSRAATHCDRGRPVNGGVGVPGAPGGATRQGLADGVIDACDISACEISACEISAGRG